MSRIFSSSPQSIPFLSSGTAALLCLPKDPPSSEGTMSRNHDRHSRSFRHASNSSDDRKSGWSTRAVIRESASSQIILSLNDGDDQQDSVGLGSFSRTESKGSATQNHQTHLSEGQMNGYLPDYTYSPQPALSDQPVSYASRGCHSLVQPGGELCGIGSHHERVEIPRYLLRCETSTAIVTSFR